MKNKETLEEAAEIYAEVNAKDDNISYHNLYAPLEYAFKQGAKWQEQNSDKKYSEEDIAIAFDEGQSYSVTGKLIHGKDWVKTHKKEWFEQLKNNYGKDTHYSNK